jgi:hypothetical protein
MMMQSSFSELEKILLSTPTRQPEDEWKLIREYLAINTLNNQHTLRWIFLGGATFVENRVRAGREIAGIDDSLKQDLNSLIKSNDPDDRDTALTFLHEMQSLVDETTMLKLLKDEYPYIRLLATELFAKYGNLAIPTLIMLADSSDSQISERAKELLERFN